MRRPEAEDAQRARDGSEGRTLMQARNGRFSPLRSGAAVAMTLLLVLPEAPAYAQRRGGGGGRSASRGSVNSVNRSSAGTGGSWSNPRTSGTTSRTATGSGSSRSTTAQTRSGETVSGKPQRQQVGRRGHGQPQRPEHQRRQQELAEDLRDGRRAGRVGGAQRPGDEPLRPDGRAGRARPSARVPAGSSRARATTSTGRRSRPRVTARGVPMAGASSPTSRAAATATGRWSPGGRTEGRCTPRRCPTGPVPTTTTATRTTATAAPTIGPTATTAFRTTATCTRPGAATTRRSRSAPSR